MRLPPSPSPRCAFRFYLCLACPSDFPAICTTGGDSGTPNSRETRAYSNTRRTFSMARGANDPNSGELVASRRARKQSHLIVPTHQDNPQLRSRDRGRRGAHFSRHRTRDARAAAHYSFSPSNACYDQSFRPHDKFSNMQLNLTKTNSSSRCPTLSHVGNYSPQRCKPRQPSPHLYSMAICKSLCKHHPYRKKIWRSLHHCM